MLTRDHMDLGSSLCELACRLGLAHHFHSRKKKPDEARRCRGDPYTTTILWPNYHSGANGDFQEVQVIAPPTPCCGTPTPLLDWCATSRPHHPHEGVVALPDGAQTILAGVSRVSGNRFSIASVMERDGRSGRVLAESTFHHFCDFNWDPRMGSPSFVSETPGTGMLDSADALRSTKQYMRNIASWLTDAER